MVLQDFVLQGDAVFIAINGVQFLFHVKSRGFLVYKILHVPNFVKTLHLDHFEGGRLVGDALLD